MTAVREAAPQRSLGRELVRPRSLLLLAGALAVAVLFAMLGQWQLGRAVQNGTVVDRPTETVLPLTSVAQPQEPQTSASVGQMVRTAGSWVPGDFFVVDGRLNRGTMGSWVTGHLITDRASGAQLAVAVGWAPDRRRAQAVADRLNAEPPQGGAIVGRYLDSDGPGVPSSGPATVVTAMSVPQLLNLWRQQTDGPVYNGYLVAGTPVAGLTTIDSPRPEQQVELNLLNILYAAEWVLFALAGLYVWYRLVRDRWERLRTAEADPGEA